MDIREEDANISAFRRGNKIVAVGFTLLIISLTLFILVLSAVLLLPTLTASLSYPVLEEISVEKFCSYSQAPMCITALNSVVADRFATDPQQLVALSIGAAAADLQNLISAAVSSNMASEYCAESLRQGAELTRLSVEETVRAKRPVLGWLIKERDEVVVRWLMGAEGAVKPCLRELAEAESPAALARVEAKMDYVRAYLFSTYAYLDRSGGIERNDAFYMETDFENLFGIFLCGVQLFVLGLVCVFFRNHRSCRVSLKQVLFFFCQH